MHDPNTQLCRRHFTLRHCNTNGDVYRDWLHVCHNTCSVYSKKFVVFAYPLQFKKKVFYNINCTHHSINHNQGIHFPLVCNGFAYPKFFTQLPHQYSHLSMELDYLDYYYLWPLVMPVV